MANFSERKTRFHRFCGENILRLEANTAAYRNASYNGGLVFSDEYLKPGEFFVVEIQQSTDDWNGVIRLGITQVDVRTFASRGVPKQALPDLMNLGPTWVYGITYTRNSREENLTCKGEPVTENITVTETSIETCRGIYCRSAFRTMEPEFVEITYPADVGSRVGVVYIPFDEEVADLYFIVNGELFGPLNLEIPYKQAPIRAVIDIYGGTEKVKIVQLNPRKYNVRYLKSLAYKTL